LLHLLKLECSMNFLKAMMGAVAGAVAAGGVTAQTAQALPSAGAWELSVTMEGAPGGGNSHSGKTCLAADALAAAPEQTLMEAAGRQGARQGPKCEFKDIRRDGGNSSWQAVCDGPMGKMQGLGSAKLGADSAELQQSFTVKAPIGTMNLKQSVSARRVGSC
jgi:Protein of unknown function (DUF3617)